MGGVTGIIPFMGDVVEFKPKTASAITSEALIWSCVGCGGHTFKLWVDGSVFCADCHGWCHTLVIGSKDV